MDTTLVRRLRAAAERLFRGGPLLAAYAYGSRVSRRPRPASHVDVGYYLPRFPRDNADSFAVLVEEGILPGESSEPLRTMTRCPTRLVHLYWDVDDRRIHDDLKRGLADIESFANAIGGREW